MYQSCAFWLTVCLHISEECNTFERCTLIIHNIMTTCLMTSIDQTFLCLDLDEISIKLEAKSTCELLKMIEFFFALWHRALSS